MDSNTEVAKNDNHISSLRKVMLDQLHALRAAPAGEAMEAELLRSKGISDLSQTIINSAKVEVEYLVATGQEQSKFLEEPAEIHTGNVPTRPGITRNSADRMKNALKSPATPWAGLGSVK